MTKELFMIQRKTPATNFYTIHKNLRLQDACELLLDISENYIDEAEATFLYSDNDLFESLTIQPYDTGNDVIEYRIVEQI